MKLSYLKDKTIRIVLSGGGVKGMAHIGIIKALNKRDIYPDTISGVSAGAIVGALYANGTSPLNMLAFFKDSPLFKAKNKLIVKFRKFYICHLIMFLYK